MKTNDHVLWLILGLAIGASFTALSQSNHATAQGAEAGVYVLGNSASTNASVWRLNTMTGALEVCTYGGQCNAMPAPH